MLHPPTSLEARHDTSTAICGSDLHLYKILGMFMTEGDIIGHEPMDIVEEVGPEVTHFKPGDRASPRLAGAVRVGTACGNDTKRWGDEAVAHVEAFEEAAGQRGGAVLGFYGSDVVIDDPASVGDCGAGPATIGGAITAVLEGVALGDFAIDRCVHGHVGLRPMA